MNSDPDKLRTLLDDVLPASSEHCGPSSSEVLTMLRHERHRKSGLRAGAALLSILLVAAGALLWHHEPTIEAPVIQALANPPPIEIQTVNDAQLLALLQETPAALMTMPDGTSTLFIIEP